MNAPKARFAAALLALAFPLTSTAALNAYLKIDNIKGESTDEGHKDEITIESWSFGATSGASLAGGGAGTGKSCLTDIAFVKPVDRASPALLQAAMLGARIPAATLAVRKSGEGQKDYLIITLKDVLVTSVSQSSGGDVPMESLSLNFGSLRMQYKVQDLKGGLGETVETTVSSRC